MDARYLQPYGINMITAKKTPINLANYITSSEIYRSPMSPTSVNLAHIANTNEVPSLGHQFTGIESCDKKNIQRGPYNPGIEGPSCSRISPAMLAKA